MFCTTELSSGQLTDLTGAGISYLMDRTWWPQPHPPAHLILEVRALRKKLRPHRPQNVELGPYKRKQCEALSPIPLPLHPQYPHTCPCAQGPPAACLSFISPTPAGPAPRELSPCAGLMQLTRYPQTGHIWRAGSSHCLPFLCQHPLLLPKGRSLISFLPRMHAGWPKVLTPQDCDCDYGLHASPWEGGKLEAGCCLQLPGS